MSIFGVVIDVPEPHARVLTAARESFGDPEARHVPPHVTVVGPVSIDPEAMPSVDEHLEEAVRRCAPFWMHLRGTGTFRPVTPTVFVAVAEGIPGCEELERRIRCGPLGVDLRYPYHPHVTVAFDLPAESLDRAFEELADFDAVFTVDAVRLVELDDGRWQVRRAYALTG
ncbi:MAG: 2'-5' RNA ligase family protein [Candidatus Nanopelagicales bacterium]